jgi:hypothetical protein
MQTITSLERSSLKLASFRGDRPVKQVLGQHSGMRRVKSIVRHLKKTEKCPDWSEAVRTEPPSQPNCQQPTIRIV